MAKSIISPIFALELQLFNKKDVRLNFQKSITNSQATLPVVSALMLLLWLLLPPVGQPVDFTTPDYGIWKFVPTFLQRGYVTLGIGALCAALAVYGMAELNNANVLLRVSSRMLSSVLAILLGMAVMCHPFQPGMVLMLLSLLSFFPLFAMYQTPSPFLAFLTYLALSVASLFFPKLLWIVPFYWLIQSYFRSLTLRCLVASILATILPYWVYAAIAALMLHWEDFLLHFQEMISFQMYDYTQIPLRHLFTFGLVFLLFAIGSIDFYLQQYRDRTRTRTIYRALIIYGVVLLMGMVAQPQYFITLFPLFLLSTAILFGHFFALTHTRFSHICCIVVMLLVLMDFIAQYLPSQFLPLSISSYF